MNENDDHTDSKMPARNGAPGDNADAPADEAIEQAGIPNTQVDVALDNEVPPLLDESGPAGASAPSPLPTDQPDAHTTDQFVRLVMNHQATLLNASGSPKAPQKIMLSFFGSTMTWGIDNFGIDGMRVAYDKHRDNCKEADITYCPVWSCLLSSWRRVTDDDVAAFLAQAREEFPDFPVMHQYHFWKDFLSGLVYKSRTKRNACRPMVALEDYRNLSLLVFQTAGYRKTKTHISLMCKKLAALLYMNTSMVVQFLFHPEEPTVVPNFTATTLPTPTAATNDIRAAALTAAAAPSRRLMALSQFEQVDEEIDVSGLGGRRGAIANVGSSDELALQFRANVRAQERNQDLQAQSNELLYQNNEFAAQASQRVHEERMTNARIQAKKDEAIAEERKAQAKKDLDNLIFLKDMFEEVKKGTTDIRADHQAENTRRRAEHNEVMAATTGNRHAAPQSGDPLRRLYNEQRSAPDRLHGAIALGFDTPEGAPGVVPQGLLPAVERRIPATPLVRRNAPVKSPDVIDRIVAPVRLANDSPESVESAESMTHLAARANAATTSPLSSVGANGSLPATPSYQGSPPSASAGANESSPATPSDQGGSSGLFGILSKIFSPKGRKKSAKSQIDATDDDIHQVEDVDNESPSVGAETGNRNGGPAAAMAPGPTEGVPAAAGLPAREQGHPAPVGDGELAADLQRGELELVDSPKALMGNDEDSATSSVSDIADAAKPNNENEHEYDENDDNDGNSRASLCTVAEDGEDNALLARPDECSTEGNLNDNGGGEEDQVDEIRVFPAFGVITFELAQNLGLVPAWYIEEGALNKEGQQLDEEGIPILCQRCKSQPWICKQHYKKLAGAMGFELSGGT